MGKKKGGWGRRGGGMMQSNLTKDFVRSFIDYCLEMCVICF